MADDTAYNADRTGKSAKNNDARRSVKMRSAISITAATNAITAAAKKGFQRPGLSETVRAVIRLVPSREWSPEEIREAFSELAEE